MMVTVNIIRRSRPNKNGLFPLQLKVTMNGESIRNNIGESVRSTEWSDEAKKASIRHPNSKRLNNYVQKKIIDANKLILDLEERGEDFSLQLVKAKMVNAGIIKASKKGRASLLLDEEVPRGKKKRKKMRTVFEMCKEYLDTLKLAKDYNRYSSEQAGINHLKRYTGRQDLVFEEMTVSFLRGYKAYIMGAKGVSAGTAVNYLITLRIIYNRAIQEGIVEQKWYPYGKNKISCKRPESEKIGLEDWEVKLIEEVDLDPHSFLHHARNVWLFSFYNAGCRGSDTLCLRWNRVVNGRLHYVMRKNQKPGSIKITQKAQAILDIYRTSETKPSDLVFPDLQTVNNFSDKEEVQKKIKYRMRKINTAMRTIAQRVGLTKDVTFHISRHSFATIAGDRVSIQRLQHLYRHSSIVTTVNYQKAFLRQGADDALETILNF